MSEARTQKDRTMAIATPLGDDALLLAAMHGSESLGRLFEYELDLMAENSPVDYTKILGQNVTVRLERFDNQIRYFNGYISRFSFIAMDESRKDNKKIYHYRATMVPWTWFLSRTADCRIFQNKTVRDIIKDEIFKKRGFTDVDDQCTGTYRTWEYCVQYRETDFNFVSRLMENEGIYYYFKHENGKHTLVMCDAPAAHKAADDYTELHFDEPDLSSGHDAFIWNWVMGHEITPNQYALTDYDPLQPQAQLEKTVNVDHSHDPDTYEIFDYPGGYAKPGDAKTYANTRMEELELQYAVAHGTSSARGIHVGCTFKLLDHPAFDEDEYLITSMSYQLRNDDMGTGGGDTDDDTYLCQVTCIPKTYEFRTPRTTPKPIVQGPQTAKVVGPSGEEIYTDKYGQVKVKFYWDRAEKSDETSSCWVRVSQPLAGKKWGFVSIPRIGQEVIVDFLEGDPDRPIITGRVFNGDNMPPYELPGNSTMTSLKSNSKTGGGFNEIRLEDKKDEEQMFINAQKNIDIHAGNDRFENIDRDRHLVVKRDKFEHVKNKRHELVDVDHLEYIKNDRHLKVGGKEAKEVVGTQSLKITGDVTEEFGGQHSQVVKGDLFLKGDNVVIEGKSSVTVKVGSNYVAIDSMGIKLGADGPGATMEISSVGNLTVETKMNASMKAQMNFDIQAQLMGSFKAQVMLTVQSSVMLQLKGSAMAQMQGGIIMIN